MTLDGTANPDFRGPLAGPDYQIRAELGRRAGPNLFHSFERFNLRTGESATFSGPDAIRNVITRVTGGERSDIDGTLRSTIPGADLYFLNPAGVLFGPNARLDLQGSFHVSTADELRFADGARFSATDPAASSFTVAAPEAFGFLGADPGSIIVDRSTLEVRAGKSLSLIGGDVTIDGGGNGHASGGTQGIVRAEAGSITLAALSGPGGVSLTGGDPAAAAAADIWLTDQALVDASGNGGETIWIRSGRFLVSNSSFVFADNTGDADVSNGITLKAKAVRIESASAITADGIGAGDAGMVVIAADSLAVQRSSEIHSTGFGEGDAGSVVITADDLTVRGGSVVSSDTFGEGAAGRVAVKADSLAVRRSSEIHSTGFGEGDAGSVVITADDLTVRGGSLISSDAFGEGDAGMLAVNADHFTVWNSSIRSIALSRGGPGRVFVTAGDLKLRHSRISSSSSIQGDAGMIVVTANNLMVWDDSFIESDTFGEGDGGRVVVTADDLVMKDGAISSATFDQGDAGMVVVRAENLTIRSGFIFSDAFDEGDAGRVVVTADHLTIRGGGSITSEANPLLVQDAAAKAGEIRVTASVLEVREGGSISSAALGEGSAGQVSVSADRLLLDRGAITTSSESAGGGEIRITVKEFIDLRDSAVSSSVGGGDDPTAGDVLIDPKILVIDHSSIEADAATGSGGNVRIIADNVLVPGGDLEGLIARGEISASGATEAVSGTVVVNAPEVDLSGGLVVLEGALLDASSQLRQRCAARRDVGASSFSGVGRGGLPPSPDGPLLSDYALQAGPAIEIDELPAAASAAPLVLRCGGPE